jgi:phytanoyl-CoA hydroxylase
MATLAAAELDGYRRDGYLVARRIVAPALVAAALRVAREQLAARQGPLELEAELDYPGSPRSRSAPGGDTVRRLLQAYGRAAELRALATHPQVLARLRELLAPDPWLVLAHHNCVMTKMPRYSSRTGWHQDIRYWSYRRAELVSAWFALGPERPDNGCLSFLPGTHRMTFGRERLDERLFLRDDLPENQALIATRSAPELEAGDVVFFHCRLFHAAGHNATTATKFSPVYTYRAADDPPLPGTRSASAHDVAL